MEFIFGKDVGRRLEAKLVDHFIEVFFFLIEKADWEDAFKFLLSGAVVMISKWIRAFDCQNTERGVVIEEFIERKVVKFGDVKYKRKIVVGLDVEYLVDGSGLIDDENVGSLLEELFADSFPDFLDLLPSGWEQQDILAEQKLEVNDFWKEGVLACVLLEEFVKQGLK